MALATTPLMRDTIGADVPLGMNSADQASVCSCGKPVSFADGTLGIAAARCGMVTTIAFSLSLTMCGVAVTT
jgi:hypothetical protein